ncbi:MAG: S8 family serine peptidase [Flavobacteriaceae bacterium]|nr:S8 family serine peptidase [Flavobacteriaceae bacterium]
MKKLVFLLTLLLSQLGFSQIQDAWVFFADKENVQTSIDNPLTILTQEAIDRKALHEVVIDERDVPVTESYITQIKNAPGITYWAKSKWMNCVYVQGTQSDIEDLLNLSFVIDIEWADKSMNFTNPGGSSTRDKFEIENSTSRIEYNYGAAANQIEMIHGDHLHELDFTGDGMKIAVLDAGFPGFASNPGFAAMVNEGRLLGTYDFFSRTTDVTGTGQHGVNTTSDMGGFLLNQFVGTAPQASYYLFRTEYGPDEIPREEAWWVEALERADSLGVDVTNTSLGYREYDNPAYTHTYEDLNGLTTFAARGANIATEKGMIIVTSAGNEGPITVGTPADALDILAVGAVNSSGNYASFSSRGPTVDGRIKPDVMAQGQGSAVIRESGNVDFSSGTSFSSPILAGAVACLWQSKPEIKNTQLMQIIRETASLYNNPTNQMGYGIANFQAAYNSLHNLGIEEQFLKENFAVYPNPVSDRLNVSFPKNVSQATVTMFNILGKKVLEVEVTSTNNQVVLSSLPQGVYIAKVVSEETKNSFKIIKL